MKKTLMQALLDAGYPAQEMFHHYSDLYIFLTPLTARVLTNWFRENGLNKCLFVSVFQDQVTGRPMYDCAFQYTPGFAPHAS